MHTLVDVLNQRADQTPGKTAFVFTQDRAAEVTRLSFSELNCHARSFAARLARDAAPGDRAILLFPTGPEFVVAFFGCLAAGIIAVPLMLPRRTADRDASEAVTTDCAPKLIITTPEILEGRPDISDRFRGFTCMTVSLADNSSPFFEGHSPTPNDIAYLQYTSGSTSTPKGVVIRHSNLLANLEMIRQQMSNTPQSTNVGWVPLYHDMGLMMGVLQPLYLGAMSVLMPPAAFMQRPLIWLKLIHLYRAEVSSAPNFAFDLCVSRFRPEQMESVDLSCWKLALNGAEPVKAETIARFCETFSPYGFNAGTMYPGYGLAEATLLVSGGSRGHIPHIRVAGRNASQRGKAPHDPIANKTQTLVSCGHSVPGQQIAIVDPETRVELGPGQIGEIWISGPHIAAGYWNNLTATAEAFRAKLADHTAGDWLRTGDLGLMDNNNQLFVTGRIKDLIIIRGVNHYPQDIERTVQEAHPAMRRDCGAAFAITDDAGNERLAIIQEVERTHRKHLDVRQVMAQVQEAVIRQHDISVETIALIPPAALPKTTSGKIQRSLAKRLWLDGAFEVLN